MTQTTVSHRSAYHSGSAYSLRLRDAEQIAGAGDHDEEIVAEHDEPRRDVAGEPRAAGALHDIERGGEQHVAAEREDHRRGVQRPHAAERDPRQIEIEHRKGELERGPQADREAGDAPEHRGDGRELDRAHIVVGLAVDGERRQLGRAVEVAIDDREDRRDARGREQIGVEGIFRRVGVRRDHEREERERRERERRAAFAEGHAFSCAGRLRHVPRLMRGVASRSSAGRCDTFGTMLRCGDHNFDKDQTARSLWLSQLSRLLSPRYSGARAASSAMAWPAASR